MRALVTGERHILTGKRAKGLPAVSGLSLFSPLIFTLEADHLVRRGRNGDARMAFGANADALIEAVVHQLHGAFSIIGSANFGNRSFELNDEVNLAMLDPEVAGRLEQDFATDLTKSKQITYEEWRKRPVTERVHEWFGALLQRQQ